MRRLNAKLTFLILFMLFFQMEVIVARAEPVQAQQDSYEESEINRFDEKGSTPLIREVLAYQRKPSEETLMKIENLLKRGADPNLLSNDHYKKSAFHWAFYLNFHLAVIELLVGYGANVDSYDGLGVNLALAECIRKNRLDLAKFFLEKGANPNLSASLSFDSSLLLQAVHKKDVEMVKLLLAYGANPNNGSLNIAPLNAAVLSEDIAMVKLLVESGADLTWRYKNGRTPLKIARISSTKEIADYLESKGAPLE